MRIVITGGTGFIGRKLVSALAARGDTPVVLTRDVASARDHFGQAGLQGVHVEAYEPERAGAWTSIVESCDGVVHLAGAGVVDHRWTRSRLALIRSSRVEPARLLAEAIARAQTKPRVWVSASAVGIYGMRKDDAVLDEQAPHGDDVLTHICEAWEAAADPARQVGVRVAHPRIGIVLGADGGALARMIPAFKTFMGGPLGDGRQWVSWIHWRDVVRGLVWAIDRPDLAGPYNLCAPRPVTMNELAHTLGQVMHRPAAMHVPGFALKLALGDAAEALLTGQRVVPTRLERDGFTFDYPELLPALREAVGEHAAA